MADYARGGYIPAPEGATDDLLLRIGQCETLICHDGAVRRNGVLVGRIDMDKARALLERINQRQDERDPH